MKLHFIGIGGIGISGLAQLCVSRGDVISGSNLGKTNVWPILESLESPPPQREGVRGGRQIENHNPPPSPPYEGGNFLFDFHDEKHVPEDCDAVIYSEAIIFSGIKNVELEWAKKNNIPTYSYFEYLGKISEEYRTIAVAGTHGKTTTTGLIASGLIEAGFDFTALVGSTLREFGGSNFKPPQSPLSGEGKKEWLLVEACEYRENFQFLNPEVVILTNIEFDHADHFRDEGHYFGAFEDLISKAQTVIFHAEDGRAHRVLKNFIGEKVSVSEVPDLSLQIPGEHNRQNAALGLGLVQILNEGSESENTEKFIKGMEQFSGAGRRQEFLGVKESVQIFDDYGHHPTEIRATIAAFREKFPGGKIALIFEPHQYSRTKMFFDAFVESLKLSNHTAIFPIYAARDTEEDKKNMSHEILAQAVGAETVETVRDVKDFLKRHQPDVLLFMGAGKISEFAREFMKAKL